MFVASPCSALKKTWLPENASGLYQYEAGGSLSSACRKRRSAPVATASPPFMSATHQSTTELSLFLSFLRPRKSRREPESQIGYAALSKSAPKTWGFLVRREISTIPADPG